jgi:hypothetical protein
MKLLIVLSFLLTSLNVFSQEIPSHISCKFHGQYEVQKKKFLSKKYKTIQEKTIYYNPMGIRKVFDLNEKDQRYSFTMSSFNNFFAVNFTMNRISDTEVEFEVKSQGEVIKNVIIDVTKTLTPRTKILNTPEPKVFQVIKSVKKRRMVIKRIIFSCVQGKNTIH